MLSYNEILPKKCIKVDGEPYEVLDAHIFRKQQRKPVNQTKLRHLKTGKVTERSFHQSESVEEADVEKRSAIYHYSRRGESWFSDPDDPKNRFSVADELVGSALPFLTEGCSVDAILLEDEIIGIEAPVKVELKVTEAPPAVKGNTAQGASKQVKLESGASVTVPLFINEGDLLRVNTQTGEYVERVEKA